MSKIREIIEKYAEHIEQSNKFAKFRSIPKFISSNDFDKLEEDLRELIKSAIKENRKKRFKNKNDVIGI